MWHRVVVERCVACDDGRRGPEILVLVTALDCDALCDQRPRNGAAIHARLGLGAYFFSNRLNFPFSFPALTPKLLENFSSKTAKSVA